MVQILKSNESKPDVDRDKQREQIKKNQRVGAWIRNISIILAFIFYIVVSIADGDIANSGAYTSCDINKTSQCLNSLFICTYDQMIPPTNETNVTISFDLPDTAFYSQEPCVDPQELNNKNWFKKLTTPEGYLTYGHKELCGQGGCERFLQPGESYGRPPTFLEQSALAIAVLIVSIGSILGKWYEGR
jgi:hypothetical protein